MKVNGIIAEYNPFHNGHKYQLEESKRATGADYTLVVLSGNFVQRGGPALLSKHQRAEMALRNGADLVLELPAVYACSSAEYFANSAVSLMNQLGVVDHLCFGSESGDLELLRSAAEILYKEPESFSADLKYRLRQGLTYPAARTEALIQYNPLFAKNTKIFSTSNNILGIEYIKALLKNNSSIEPFTLSRLGSDYNDPNPEGDYCSAFAIRQTLLSSRDSLENLCTFMPEASYKILADSLHSQPMLDTNSLSMLLYYKLLAERDKGFTQYADISEALSDRIVNRLGDYRDFDSFCNLLKTKELTYARISRCLLHIVLNITKEDILFGAELNYAPYARVLGFRKEASPLLKTIKANSSIPLLTKLANAHKTLDANAYCFFTKDTQISQLYYGLQANYAAPAIGSKSDHIPEPPKNEFTIPVVTI